MKFPKLFLILAFCAGAPLSHATEDAHPQALRHPGVPQTLAPTPAALVPRPRPLTEAAFKDYLRQAIPRLPIESTLKLDVAFEFGSARIGSRSQNQLDELCAALERVPGDFLIIGHTDSFGPALYNLSLSQFRAEVVRAYLITNCGVAAARLFAVGVGESYPLADTAPSSRKNRRIEVLLWLGEPFPEQGILGFIPLGD